MLNMQMHANIMLSVPMFSSHTFDIQNHARESKAGNEASHLGCPRLDRLPVLCPQNHLGCRLNVAHHLKAHGRGQLQHTHYSKMVKPAQC